MTTLPVVVHVAPDGNAFMADIASWVAEAVESSGRAASVSRDGSLPAADDGVLSLVVAPHEFYGLSPRPVRDLRRAAASSIPIATEQPGTPWFDESIRWCREAPWALDINEVGVAAAIDAGVDTRLLGLGAVPSMDHRRSTEAVVRSVDLAVLAGLTNARASRLAAGAGQLWARRAELRLFPTDRPVTSAAPGGPLFGAAKYDLMAQTSILLNLHRDGGTTYFEWARAVEAMANGCVVVTEPSSHMRPLEDDVHLVVADDPVSAAVELLDDPDRLRRIGDAAADLVHGDLALDRTLAPILDAAEQAVTGVDRPPLRIVSRASAQVTAPLRIVSRRGEGRPSLPAFRPHLALRRRLLDAVVAERRLRREIDAERCRRSHGAADHVAIIDSPAWDDAAVDVSAIVTLFDYGDLVTDTLDSVVASEDVTAEIVVVDDHSTDDGRAVVADWIASNPDVPARLVGRDANGGLAAARNLAIEQTRTDRIMVLDADNLVYPTCLARLSSALDHDPEAVFAWSILEQFGEETGLLSAFAWDAGRLGERNWIDAQVMLRRDSWTDLGGYRELPGMLPGWEDWDLWLRVAAAGRHGALVPQILGRYRAQGGSMVSGPNRFNDVMLERFEALHPDIDFPPR